MTTLRWEALGGDPAPGDPGAFDALARAFSDTADNAGDAHAKLTRFSASVDASIWSGEAADAFREKIGELPPQLKKLHDSYAAAAEGMGDYGRTLRDLQAEARALLGKAQAAHDEKAAQERSRDQAQAADPLVSAAAYDAALADAGRRLGSAEAEIEDLRERRVAAERAAVGKLEDAQGLGTRNDPWYKRAWDAIDAWVDEHADILRVISNILKVVSAAAGLLSLIPFLAPIFGPVALIAGGLALLTDAALAATGNGDWKMLLVDAALMALPGAGRLVSRFIGGSGRVVDPAARAAAKTLGTAAKKAAPAVTRDLKQLARQNGAKMVGLRHRLKSPSSLERKIALEMKRGPSAEEAAARIKDSLRYTMTAPEKTLSSGVRNALDGLEQQGYQVGKVKNYWVEGNSYKGVNVEMRTPQGHPFELQFHTEKSFDLKMNSHADYEIVRNPDQPLELRQQAHDRMVEASSTLRHPSGIEDFGELIRVGRPER